MIDAMAPGVAELLAGKARAAIGTGEERLGGLTGHPENAKAGRQLEVEQIRGDIKAATVDAAEPVKAPSERISEKLKGQPRQR